MLVLWFDFSLGLCYAKGRGLNKRQWVIYVKNEKFSLYPEDFNFYYIVRVHTDDGVFYAYNSRLLVRSLSSAKPFNTRRSALRCIRLGGFSNAEIITVKRN